MNFAMDIAHMKFDSFSRCGKCMIVIIKHIFDLGMIKVRRDRGVYNLECVEFFVQKKNNDRKIFLFFLRSLQC